MKQYYKIAGLTVAMDSFGKNVTQAIPYRTEPSERADIVLAHDWKDAKKAYPEISEEICEYMAACREFYRELLNHNGMMVHASAVVLNGYAYLFSADSGTGKSTHTSVWRNVFGDENVRVLNDDKPAVRLVDGVWYAYGTPWSGKTGQNLNICAPLAGICFLRRGEHNSIRPYHGKQVILEMMKQTSRPPDAKRTMKLMEVLDELIRDIPIWEMQCNMEPEAALVSYQAMRPKCD